MSEPKTTKDLEKFLDYKFKEKEILEAARRRGALSKEKGHENTECMDPLATLGDAVLDLVAVNRLYDFKENRTKGKLTEFRSRQVKRERTCAFARECNLEEYILWSKGEQNLKVWLRGNKALDTVTEAIIGAMFLDAQDSGKNGLKIVQEFLERKEFFK